MADARNSPIIDAIEELEAAGAEPGTAGTPSEEVLSIQGVTGGSPVRILPLSPTSSTGSITAAAQTVQHTLSGTESSVSLILYGTFTSLQIAFEYTPDGGTNWGACLAYYQGVSNSVSGQTSYAAISASAVASPAYTIAVPAGATHVRIRSLALTSGTVNVKMTSDPLTRPVTGLQQVSIGSNTGSAYSLVAPSSDAASAANNALVAVADQHTYAGALINAWARARHPNVFKTASATASGDTAVWVPTTGRKFNLLGGVITVPSGATSATQDVIITLRDNATSLGISTLVSLPSALNLAGPYHVFPFNIGPVGVMSAAANNQLSLHLSAAMTGSPVRVSVWGTEE